MVARRVAETAARNIGSAGFRLLRRFRSRRGNVRNALVGRGGPVAPMEIPAVLSAVIVVRKRIPGAIRRVIIADARNVIVVCVNVVGINRRL